MNFIISGRNIDITPGLRQAVEQKLGKLEKYFTPETDIIVTLSVEKERQKIEVTIPVKGNIIRSEQESVEQTVSYSFTCLEGDQGSLASVLDISFIRSVAVKGCVHDTVTFCIGQEFSTITDQTS